MIKLIYIYAIPFFLTASAIVHMRNEDKRVKGCGIAQLILSLPPLLLTLASITAAIADRFVSYDNETARKIIDFGNGAAIIIFTIGIVYYALLAAAELILLLISSRRQSAKGKLFLIGFFLCAAAPFVIYSLYPLFD